MTDKKISQLTVVTDLHGPELFPVVQSGITKAARISDLASYSIPTSWEYGATRPGFPTNGEMFFDTNLSPARPVWYSGPTNGWVDAAGLSV